MENPFYQYNDLPKYDAITPERAEGAIARLLATAGNQLLQLERTAEPTWEGCMAPRLALAEPLAYAWHIVGHMLNVMNTNAWRSTQEKLQPLVVAFFSKLGQSRILFANMQVLRNGPAYEALTSPRKRILENDLREAIQAGAASPPDVRVQLTKLHEQMAADSATFLNHAMDASKAVVLTLTEQHDIVGLPRSLLAIASDAAQRNGYAQSTTEAGPWVITHEAPLYVPFLQYSERRDLRETLYRAHMTRASEGDLDNEPVLAKLLLNRKQIAKLLGKPTYAELVLEGRMAQSVDAVQALIDRVRAVAKPAAQAEYDTMQAYARRHGQTDPLAAWDVAFWSERIRKDIFAFDNEALRPYFPFPHVLQCLLQTVKQLFAVSIEPADGQASVWHPDVRFFAVKDAAGQVIAHLYLDPYSRPESKRGGAWMDAVLSRSRMPDDRIRLPAALMCCNQARPTESSPSLMTLTEVITLYHECGHALQHTLTTVDLAAAAGINNVEWDAVELPSQFMENWVYHRPFLKNMSRHVETGEPLPDKLIDQILAARWFQAGSQTLRQLFFSALDMGLHHEYDPDTTGKPDDFKMRLAPDYTIIPPLPEDRFLCGFSHIFAGGYAAGYYSYKWAEVLAADAFAAFEEAGLQSPDTIAATGKRFRNTVLALGGSKHPMDVFRQFRGREPDPDALLRQSGLLRET